MEITNEIETIIFLVFTLISFIVCEVYIIKNRE